MLCSPIILYDYPQSAPESEGDFFDGTEMDEMLTLRVLTLTDAEKQEMRAGDARAERAVAKAAKAPKKTAAATARWPSRESRSPSGRRRRTPKASGPEGGTRGSPGPRRGPWRTGPERNP